MTPFAEISLYSVVLFIHIAAVVTAFGVIAAYPAISAAARRSGLPARAFWHRAQATLGRYVISPAAVVVLLAGAYLATDRDAWSEMWVSIPLLLLFVIMGVGGAYLGPREARLADMADAGGGPGYERLAAQVTRVQYALTALVLVAIFLMVTKPGS